VTLAIIATGWSQERPLPHILYEHGVRDWKSEDEDALQLETSKSFFLGDLSIRQAALGKQIRLATSQVSPIKIHAYSSLPVQRYRRTPLHIRKNRADVYLLWIIESGFLHTQQSSYSHIAPQRSLTVTNSDISFLQELSPSLSQPFSAKIAMVPGPLYRSVVSARHGFFGNPVNTEHGVGRLIAGLVEALYDADGGLSIAIQSEVVDQILRLLEEASQDLPLGFAPSLTTGQKRRKDVFAYIDANLLNCGLSPSSVARGCGISKGHLHRLFAGSGTSFSRHVQERRLNLARMWLRRPQMADRTIGEIAAMSGFASLPHFSRSFKALFGVTPREIRGLSQSDDCRQGEF
jgi:AraC-like DNA-binding protein